jgi:uncharacterized membrane-anchored protein
VNVHEPAAWTALRDAGLVQGAAPAAALEAPWYVRLMLGVAGWIAALFLLGFVAAGMAWLIESEWGCVVGGLLGSGAAWLLLRKLGHNEFAAQFALAVSFAGQALFAYGVFGLLQGSPDSPAVRPTVWLVLALQQAALVALMPSATHRLWSGFAAAAAATLALRAGGGAFLAPGLLLGAAAWAWLNEYRWPRFGPVLRPAAFGVVLALVLFELAAGMLRPATGFDVDPAGRRLYGQLLSGAVLLGVVWVLLRRAGATLPGRAAAVGLAGTAVMVLVSLEAPGIAAGLCILVLGFAHGNRALAGLGGAALLLYAGGYYYELDLTLLAKSQVLAATGGVLLALRWVLLRWLGPPSSPRRHPGIRAANFRDPLPAGEKAPKVIDPRPRIVIGMAGALLVLAAVNASIVGKERLLAAGRVVYLELAPVDPRSLMQGDYMALNYQSANEIAAVLPQHAAGRPGAGEPVSADGRAVVRLDERSVASFVRLDDDRPLAADEALLRYRVRAGRLKFASDAFYFQEGTAEAYQAARYGRYRVADDGELLLTSLHDEHLNRLPVGSP